jgi:protein-L-isoaspartate(D-aspartate) O-methyltransferase
MGMVVRGPVFLCALLIGCLPAQQDRTAQQRAEMVREQIEARGVRDAAVLRAMREVPRHLFMPESVRHRAYDDTPVPIGHRATISQPYIVALMTELLEVRREHKVLEIGTGSGYQAAILARLGDHVYTIEIVPELAEWSRDALSGTGHRNVSVRAGDGYKGWPEQAPFDRIILTAAPPTMPKALVDQLRAPGRLVAPVGPNVFSQNLIVLEKDRRGRVTQRTVTGVAFVPMVPGGK